MSYNGYIDLVKSDHNIITIYSFSMNEEITFPAFVTDFSDSFASNWTSQEIYGKMDPISTFKNTSRSISLSFDIPSADIAQAIKFMTRCDTIIKGLYPIYSNTNKKGTAYITAPPLFRIKFGNLIVNAQNPSKGLLGYLSGFDFKPDMTMGHFIYNGIIYPKLLKASLKLNVLHEHPLGSKMVSGKPVPRIVVNNKSIYSYAHLFNSKSTSVPAEGTGQGTTPTPILPETTPQPGTEIDVYTARVILPGYEGGKIGPPYAISRNEDEPTTGEKQVFKVLTTNKKSAQTGLPVIVMQNKNNRDEFIVLPAPGNTKDVPEVIFKKNGKFTSGQLSVL